jgi:hypothetical protein
MTRKACCIFSSIPAQGAKNIQINGSRLSVQLNYPLHIEREAKHARCEIIQATSNIWNTSPNISPQVNNDLFVAYEGAKLTRQPELGARPFLGT